jgi:protein-L-isoaspartate(D-aspartate) O-methyltransferase
MSTRGAWAVLLVSLACANDRTARRHEPRASSDTRTPATDQRELGAPELREVRKRMVEEQIAARGIHDPRVLSALREVPRHEFVPAQLRPFAYEDHPLPIGHEQTISQPFIVAAMTELAELEPGDKVLEIGTGSGYQAAVLAALVRSVYSIEIVEPLAQRARQTLRRLGIDNVEVRAGDGFQGWPEQAPFDAILVTAAPPEVPAPLKAQLALGAKLVIPVGIDQQDLRVLTRTARGFEERTVLAVRFVPMTGRAQEAH